MKVKLLAHTPEPEKLVAAAAKNCYSFTDVDSVLDGLTEEKTQSFVHMLSEIGHESPIEHVSFTFAIEGVSRSLLAQITRHRMASFSVQSQRYVRERGFEYVVPPEIDKIPAAREQFIRAMEDDQRTYEALTAALMEGYVEELLAQLPGCITRYPDLHLRIGKKDFFPTFAQYEQDNTPLLLQLDACCAGYPGGAEALAGHAAAVMLDGLAAHMQKDPRWGRRTRDNVFFDTKVALAIFFTPLLRKLQLELAEPLRTQLQTQWLARWPKQLWRPGDYDTLAGGFKKFRFCFITTATCAAEGKPDDCAELTAFRAFRDGWLRQRPDGPERIAEYYAVAPSIVAGVEYCDDAPARYAEIRSRWLGPCYAALQRGEMQKCYDTYRDMVQTLKERYGVQ